MEMKTAIHATGATNQDQYNTALQHISNEHILPAGGKVRTVSEILSNDQPHPKSNFIGAFGDNPRGQLQQLRSEPYVYWMIHNVPVRSAPAVYQMDQRHLAGEPQSETNGGGFR